MRKSTLAVTLISLHLFAGSCAVAADRQIPEPLPHHPGNIYVAGEIVSIALAPERRWRLEDYEGNSLREVAPTNGRCDFGKLPVGWYRLVGEKTNEWISLAVIEPLVRPTPTNSPISIDVAMSWFYPTNTMRDVSTLCALAGVNWVRDRLSWGEMERERGVFSGPNRYDAAALAQSEAGLQVLQVNHSSPRWSAADTKRFPADLRDVFSFYRAMAARWKGQVVAFEPWNEADIPGFGGHTGAEMASLQKAAYLGLKAGNSNVIACLNVWAAHRRSQLEDFAANDAAAYFDTYNLHHYEPVEAYPRLYEDHRAVSGGRPIWVTEFAVPVKWAGDEKLKEPLAADLRVQSERLVKAFAASLHEGAQNSFYFMLPHYVEGQTQFGIIRPDLTPRPAYVALAAVARLLGDLKPAGRLVGASADVRAFVFSGANADTIVAWSEKPVVLTLKTPAVRVLDHLGRDNKRATSNGVALSSAPLFIVLNPGAAKELTLQPCPKAPAAKTEKASSVVLQPLFSEEQLVLPKSAWRISEKDANTIRVAAYNFGARSLELNCSGTSSGSTKVDCPQKVTIVPGGREILTLSVSGPASRAIEALTIRANTQNGESAVLSLRVMRGGASQVAKQWPVDVAAVQSAWVSTVSGNGLSKITRKDDEMIFEAEPKSSDRWFYPKVALPFSDVPPPGAEGVMFKFRLIEGAGTFRTLLDETNGSGYVIDWMTQPADGEAMEAVALFDDAQPGHGWSKPDSNHRFDPGQAVSLKIGCNTKTNRVKFAISNVRWVKF